MNKRPGKVVVTTEVGYCNFCGRPRNLRREDHQLGALVRSIVTCETCHRTLASTVGVASSEPAATTESEAPVAADLKPAAKKTAAKPAARKPAAKAKASAKAAKAPAKKTTTKSTTKKK
jgi:hypothetical protein